jgi:polar amino acid transport system substrate-binding protein
MTPLPLTAAILLLAAMLPAAAQPAPPAAVIHDLAPTGKLRVALNFGNSVLVQRGAQGEPHGVTPDLARELGKRLGVAIEFVPYEAAVDVFKAAGAGAWDIAFLAIEPARAKEIAFTAPYLIIEGTYMVRQDSPLQDVGDVDKPGIKIAVGVGSAYDLFLTRTLKHATIVRAANGGARAMIDLFVADHLDAVAGVRQSLDGYAADHADMRVMKGHFQDIRQAMAIPKKDGQAGEAGAQYLHAFVEDMKASGFVADALARSGQVAVVAPAEK